MRPGADDDRPALSIGGRTVTYRQFAELVNTHRQARSRTTSAPDLRSATGLSAVDVLAMIFAAAADDVPVLLADPAGPIPDPGTVPPGTFLIAVTSGTSGRPRPVLRTATSWTASFAPLAAIAGLGSDDRVLLTGHLHATMHLFAAVHTLALGAELTDRPTQATAVHAVPAVLADLLGSLPATAPLRTAVVAGAALDPAIGELALARGIGVTEYYGATELSFVAARRYPAPLRAFPGAEIEMRDNAASAEGAAEGVGTLWVRSPYLSNGYPAGVAGPLRRSTDGFATVGDLAEYTADGGLRIRGRGDAAITTGGATVIAEDIEAALAAVPGISAVAVVGLPHVRLGEVVTAVIEPKVGADLTGLRTAARALLSGPSLPRRWLVTGRLPRTFGGKIARQSVATAAAAHVAGEPLVGSPELRPLGEQS